MKLKVLQSMLSQTIFGVERAPGQALRQCPGGRKETSSTWGMSFVPCTKLPQYKFLMFIPETFRKVSDCDNLVP